MMQQFSVKCFGVGDGNACADRGHSAFLYQAGPVSLLLDCGEPVCSRFKAAGLGFASLDRIFLSHLHFDHLGGLFMFLQGSWLEGRRRELRVHLPADGLEPIRQLLEAACLFEELFPFRLRFEPLKAGQPVTVGPVRVTPIPTTHLKALQTRFEKCHPQAFEAFSFLLETDRFRAGHSADLGAVSDLEPLVRGPLDLLFCELAHVDLEEVCALLRNRAVRRVAFVHLGRRWWEELEKTKELAGRLLPNVPVVFPRDGDTVALD